MKETIKSLKWYFIIIGLLELWNIGEIGAMKNDTFGLILLLVSFIFGGVYLYMGIKLEKIINKFSKAIINFLLIDLVFIGVGLSFYILQGSFAGLRAISLIVNIVVTIYLIKNVKRLSSLR